MRITIVGGGPGGLYLAALLPRVLPEARVRLFERRADGTWPRGGLVLAHEPLDAFRDADPDVFAAIDRVLEDYERLEVRGPEGEVAVAGHGFAATERGALLRALEGVARSRGVELRRGAAPGPDDLAASDLVVAADGRASGLRDARPEAFEVSTRPGRLRWAAFDSRTDLAGYTWVLTTYDGVSLAAQAWPHLGGRASWVLHVPEAEWRAAGLAEASEGDVSAWCEGALAPHLDGAPLEGEARWHGWTEVRAGRWHEGRTVLLGDAAHTAHWSVGAGARLAMEDALALATALRAHRRGSLTEALSAYEARRRPPAETALEQAARSEAWLAGLRRRLHLPPRLLAFDLLARDGGPRYDDLRARDADFVRHLDADVATAAGRPHRVGEAPVPMFLPLRLRALELPNRLVVSPMCQYSADEGVVGDWHLAHLGSRAVGGAGLVMAEMTDVLPEGRITRHCAGLWNAAQQAAWRTVVDHVHRHTRAKIGIQLAHAGRKASARRPWEGGGPLPIAEGGWTPVGPSPLPFDAGWAVPQELDRAGMDRVVEAFADAARRAADAGFDLVELHMAHGYLLSSFLSPLSNRRTDGYGGSLAGRMRLPLEVLDAVRAAFPEERPVIVRLSATDWAGEQGLTVADAVEVSRTLSAHGCDLVDVSSGGNVPRPAPPTRRMYQAHLAARIRHEARVPVMAVGQILDADDVNTLLASGRADAVAMARALLRDPYLPLHAAERYGEDVWWPPQYLRGRDGPRGS